MEIYERYASLFLHSNATFLCERAHAEVRTAESLEALASCYLRQGAAYDGGGGRIGSNPKTSDDFRDDFRDDGDGLSLKWEISRVLLIVGAVLAAVMGVAWWLGQMIDGQDVEEALG